MQRGRKRNNVNKLSLPEKVLRVSTDEEATTFANAVTESSSDVVTVESIMIHAVYVLHHFKVMMKWKIGCNVLAKGGCMNTA